jgi:hypothetical protein
MRRLLLLLGGALALLSLGACAGVDYYQPAPYPEYSCERRVWVEGYYSAKGKYVQPHWRCDNSSVASSD